MAISNTVNRLILSGTINNIGIQQRLRTYRKSERKLAAEFSGRNVVGNLEYQEKATQVANDWVNLVVDIASFSGEPMDRSDVKDIRETLHASVSDSVGVFA